MRQDIKDRWVAALRSGEYQQGRNFLRRDNDTYCCLGVLCDLLKADLKIDWKNREFENFSFANRDVFLPGSVSSLAGLESNDPMVTVDGKQRRLSELNDKGYSFPQIADLIEQQL